MKLKKFPKNNKRGGARLFGTLEYLSKEILYQYFVDFALLGTASPLKTFYMLLKLKENINWESEITNSCLLIFINNVRL